MTDQKCPPQNPDNVEQLFHWDTQPEDRTLSEECQQKEPLKVVRCSPVRAITYITQLIQDYFNDKENFKGSLIEPLVENTTISVSGVAFSEKDKQGVTPRILVEYGGLQPKFDFAFDNQINYDMYNACQSYYCEWTMAITIYIVSKEYIETMAIAEEVRNFCNHFQEVIKEPLCWSRFRLVEEQKPQFYDELSCFVQPLAFSAMYHEVWNTTEAAPKLKTVAFNSSI